MMSDVFASRLRALLRTLSEPTADALFNPYRDHARELDRTRAAAIRRRNLRLYLERFRSARYVLVGEAAGYNGCRFSGLPFTGENFLVGDERLSWTKGLPFQRSSRGEKLSAERSAAIVWRGIGERRDIVLWNAVPWHPHRAGEPLSNRKPRPGEIRAGLTLLRRFLDLFSAAEPVAVGRVSEAALTEIERPGRYIRHPSMGGQPAFLRGLAELPA